MKKEAQIIIRLHPEALEILRGKADDNGLALAKYCRKELLKDNPIYW